MTTATWTLERQPASVPAARRLLRDEFPAMPQDALEKLNLLASELVTNALDHGIGEITMTVVTVEGRVLVRVSDANPTAPAIPAFDLQATRGRGLMLVQALADSWGTEARDGQRGKTVWFLLTV